MLTREQLRANINALEEQGATPQEIQEWLNTLSTESTTKKTPSVEEQPSIVSNKTALGRVVNKATNVGQGVSDFMFGNVAKLTGSLIGSGVESAQQLATGDYKEGKFITQGGDPKYAPTTGRVIGAALETIPYTKQGAALISAAGKKLAQPISKYISQPLYKSALKAKDVKKAGNVIKTADELADIGLKEKVVLTKGAAEKIGSKLDDILGGLDDMIKASGKTIDTKKVVGYLSDSKKLFGRQADTAAAKEALNTLDDLAKGFVKKYGTKIPITEAQAIKKATQSVLAKSYGKLSSVSIEGSKAMARGLKEEIIKALPEAGEKNLRAQNLIYLEKAVQKAIERKSSKNLVGLGLKIGAAGGGTVKKAAAGLAADILDSATLKSGAAIGIDALTKAVIKAGQKVFAPLGTVTSNIIKRTE